MKQDCLDIGVIQAFLDGEMGQGERTSVTDHVGGCQTCAARLSEAEDEMAVVIPALAREMDSLVPTQRLWARINNAIDEEKSRAPWWQTAWASLRFSLLSPTMAAAAGLLIVFGTFAILWLNRVGDTAVSTDRNVAAVSNNAAQAPPTATIAKPAIADAEIENVRGTQAVQAAYRAASRPVRAEQAVYRPVAAAAPSTVIPGEDSYVRTINGLAKTVDEQTDGGVMRPSERVAYEREMAVVNDAISRLKKELKRNPRNDPAKQVLYASYQNKIDLLNSVAQKQELMASMN